MPNTFERGGELSPTRWDREIVKILRRVDPQFTQTHWLWAYSAREGLSILQRLRVAFTHGEVDRIERSSNTLRFVGSGTIQVCVPKDEPAEKVCVAVWLVLRPMPESYARMLLAEGMCGELWCLVGTTPPEGQAPPSANESR